MPRLWRADDLGSVNGILSFAGIRRSGLGFGERFDLISMLAWGDKTVLYEDFYGDSAETTKFLETQISGGGTLTYPAVANGVARVTTGAAGADDGMVMAGNLCWMGDLNIVAQTRVRANVVTTLKVEFGFGDLAARNTEIVNDYDPPSLATDQPDVLCAVVDTGGTNGNRWQLVTDGSTTNMNATATQSGEAIGAAATALTTAVANIYDVITLTGIGNRARMYRNGNSLAHHGAVVASQFEGGSVVAPYLHGATLTTADKLIDFDYLVVPKDRT